MSKENLEQFMSKVADSEELQAKIGEEIDAEALIALGAECGCEFTAEELQDSAELSEEELGTVAGGREGAQNKYFQRCFRCGHNKYSINPIRYYDWDGRWK